MCSAFELKHNSMSQVNRLFCVVEFPEEAMDGIIPLAIISYKWIEICENKIYCLWPKVKTDTQRMKLLLEHRELEQQIASLCRINIKYKTDTYQKAVEKMKELEHLSSVSDSDIENKSERTRKKKTFENYVVDSDTDEDIVLSVSLKIQEKRKQITTADEQKPCQCVSLESSIEALIRNLCLPMLEDIKTTVDRNFQAISKLQEIKHQDVPLDLPITQSLPAESVEQLDKFNRDLQDERILRSVSHTLQVVGGKDTVDAVRRLLVKIISHQLSLKYNWSGRNEKVPFQAMSNIIKLVIGTVRKNCMCKDATQEQVESVIKLWLRNARDREGGRNRRQKEGANSGAIFSLDSVLSK